MDPRTDFPTQAFPASSSAPRLQTDSQMHLGEGSITHILGVGPGAFSEGAVLGHGPAEG